MYGGKSCKVATGWPRLAGLEVPQRQADDIERRRLRILLEMAALAP